MGAAIIENIFIIERYCNISNENQNLFDIADPPHSTEEELSITRVYRLNFSMILCFLLFLPVYLLTQ